jgi:hypothetical protein
MMILPEVAGDQLPGRQRHRPEPNRPFTGQPSFGHRSSSRHGASGNSIIIDMPPRRTAGLRLITYRVDRSETNMPDRQNSLRSGTVL